MRIYRVFPTLDMSVDVKAKDEDEAIRKVDEATEEIITDCCSKLMDLNHFESGCDFTYCTDSWPEEEANNDDPPLLPEGKEVA